MSENNYTVKTVSEGSFHRDTYPEINQADINLTQLQRNMAVIRGMLKPETRFMAVVKGDAYGHGLVPIAKELERCKCDFIGVVRLTEALSLRKAGIKAPLMMIAAFLPAQIDWIVKYDITIMLDREEIALDLQKSAARYNKQVNAHIKVNTGLNRYGVVPEDVPAFIKMIKERCPNINIEGIYTHFRDAEFNPVFTSQQIQKFQNVLGKLEEQELRPQIAHAAGSGGILFYPEAHFDMVRCGIILYGLEHKKDENMLPAGVKPLMTLKSFILRLDYIKAGESGGYGDKFIASRDSCIAIVGVGYGDGVSRGWKEVLVGSQRVPVVNHFMDGIIVDITDVKAVVKEYDEVVIIGSQGNENIAWEEACGNMNAYIDEQLQRITERVPKNYYYEK